MRAHGPMVQEPRSTSPRFIEAPHREKGSMARALPKPHFSANIRDWPAKLLLEAHPEEEASPLAHSPAAPERPEDGRRGPRAEQRIQQRRERKPNPALHARIALRRG